MKYRKILQTPPFLHEETLAQRSPGTKSQTSKLSWLIPKDYDSLQVGNN